jgi:hypothetical protein
MEQKAENFEPIAKKRMICPRISSAIVVRLILIAQSTIAIFFTTCIMDSWEYYGMFIHIIVITVDMFYCSIKNYGDDFKW